MKRLKSVKFSNRIFSRFNGFMVKMGFLLESLGIIEKDEAKYVSR